MWSLGVLIYEMYCGATPFEDPDRDTYRIYSNVVRGLVAYPIDMQPKLHQLLTGLLILDPNLRYTVTDLLRNAFFAPMDWVALHTKVIVPPYIPVIASALDTSHFVPVEDGGHRTEHLVSF